jgi:hypothetical protein
VYELKEKNFDVKDGAFGEVTSSTYTVYPTIDGSAAGMFHVSDTCPSPPTTEVIVGHASAS